ncbi:MAG: C40 family peptidase [Deltaproteobacteria bacterium]|jgi:LysM repeat protein|nr:C40 family peptidase [Deltaproteobacteria bacterium]
MNASFPSRSAINRSFCFAFLPLLAGLTLFAFGCAKNNANNAYRPTNPYSANETRVNNILKTAFSQMGNPYRYGGVTPETGFDCSGFVGWVYKQYGVTLPRSSRAMMTVGSPISKAELRPGDLVFFNYGISHVGIYTGDNKYIHSPRTGKSITESNLNGLGRKEKFVAARRIIDNQGITTISENLKTEWIAQSRHQARLALDEKAKQQRGQTALAATRLKANQPAKNNVRNFGSSIKIIVVSGDTLEGLAKKHGLTIKELAAANNLRNKHQLSLGQILSMPPKGAITPSAKTNHAANHLTAKATANKPRGQVKSAGQAKPQAVPNKASQSPISSPKPPKGKVAGQAKPASTKKSVTPKTEDNKSPTNGSAVKKRI